MSRKEPGLIETIIGFAGIICFVLIILSGIYVGLIMPLLERWGII